MASEKNNHTLIAHSYEENEKKTTTLTCYPDKIINITLNLKMNGGKTSNSFCDELFVL